MKSRGLMFAALAALSTGLLAATTVEVGSPTFKSTLGNAPAASLDDCIAKAKANAAAHPPATRRTEHCDFPIVTRVTADPPPPTCPPKPADETRAGSCPAGTSGTWTQSRGYISGPAPTCWTAGAWSPSSAPAGTCSSTLPPPTGDVIYASPPTADATQLAPGQTLVLKPGNYTSLKVKGCTAAAWCTVKAETDGTVEVAGLNLGRGNWYLRLEGLRFGGTAAKSITGSFVKMFRSGFKGGPSSGNDVAVQIGTNDYTPGASNILLEDCWGYGLGGRYKFLVYNAQKVVLRRVVARHDGGWNASDGNPQGGFALYDSQDVTCQDCLFVDSVQKLTGFEAALYLVSNDTTSMRSANVSVNGAAIIGSPNNGVAAEGHGSAKTYNVQDVAVVGSVQGGFNTNNENHVMNVTRALAVVKGAPYAAWDGTVKASACVYKGAGNQATLSNCSGTLPTDPTRPNAAGQGANLSKRIGAPGTLFGEPGYADAQPEDLWPWPNEARIKSDFDSVRPAFGGKTLTDYVRTSLQ